MLLLELLTKSERLVMGMAWMALFGFACGCALIAWGASLLIVWIGGLL